MLDSLPAAMDWSRQRKPTFVLGLRAEHLEILDKTTSGRARVRPMDQAR